MDERLKRIAKVIKYFSPSPLKKIIEKKAEKKQLEEGLERYKNFKIKKEEVLEVLNQIDFNYDIMLHTSMLNLGHISGGIKFITDELINRVTDNGHTLLVSALPYFGSFANYLHENMTFDTRNAPIAMGEINARISKLPGALRSCHPTHSVVAIGKDAQYYTATHHLDPTPFGKESPYYKIIKNKGKILLFGATMNNLTMVHAVEDALGTKHPVKDIYSKNFFKINCITQTGESVTVTTPYHNPWRSIFRRDIMLEDGMSKGYIRRFKLGDGYVTVIDAYLYAINYLEKIKQGQDQHGRCRPLHKEIDIDFN